MQRAGTSPGQFLLESVPECGVGAGELEAVDDRPDVERGATDHDRHDTTPGTIRDGLAGQGLELGDGGGLADLEDVDEVVPDGGPLGVGRLGRADVHTSVDRHRVRADDLGRLTAGGQSVSANETARADLPTAVGPIRTPITAPVCRPELVV